VPAALLALAGCLSTPTEPPRSRDQPPAQVSGSIPAPPPGARTYVVDAERTRLTFLVRRGGTLSRLGHNHVVRSASETGRAWADDEGTQGALELHLPVADFVVDDPGARAEAGPDFAASVPDDARAGTFDNMTGERLLDVAHFPEVVVRYAGPLPSGAVALVRLVVVVKGEPHALDVPLVVHAGADEVTASGETRITHGEIGLQPFSIMGGAIAVADEIGVRFELVATPRAATAAAAMAAGAGGT
jgi:hypothetical protein